MWMADQKSVYVFDIFHFFPREKCSFEMKYLKYHLISAAQESCITLL